MKTRARFEPERVRERAAWSYGSLLGMPKAGSGQMIERAAAGLPFRALETLSKKTGFAVAELARLAQIAPRTLSRRRAVGTLTADESDRVLRTARILSQAIELFEGNVEEARRWLNAPQRAFGGKLPVDLASTDSGAWEVEKLIFQLEDGIFI